MSLLKKKTVVVHTETTVITGKDKEKEGMKEMGPKNVVGRLDMIIAFDTTGSMAAYIGAVRKEVSELIPRLFKENEDLRLGIVAFGDYCDMKSADVFGSAYQCIAPTNDENALIRFVKESKDTGGGDGDEFYELVLKKIIEETPWRDGSTRAVLLIADADPHKVGYSYRNIVQNAQIDWREEARKAAGMNIRIDTVTICDLPWYKELSAMTNGISVPFKSGNKTADLVEASVMARGSMSARMRFDEMRKSISDPEMMATMASYAKARYEDLDDLDDDKD